MPRNDDSDLESVSTASCSDDDEIDEQAIRKMSCNFLQKKKSGAFEDIIAQKKQSLSNMALLRQYSTMMDQQQRQQHVNNSSGGDQPHAIPSAPAGGHPQQGKRIGNSQGEKSGGAPESPSSGGSHTISYFGEHRSSLGSMGGDDASVPTSPAAGGASKVSRRHRTVTIGDAVGHQGGAEAAASSGSSSRVDSQQHEGTGPAPQSSIVRTSTDPTPLSTATSSPAPAVPENPAEERCASPTAVAAEVEVPAVLPAHTNIPSMGPAPAFVGVTNPAHPAEETKQDATQHPPPAEEDGDAPLAMSIEPTPPKRRHQQSRRQRTAVAQEGHESNETTTVTAAPEPTSESPPLRDGERSSSRKKETPPSTTVDVAAETPSRTRRISSNDDTAGSAAGEVPHPPSIARSSTNPHHPHGSSGSARTSSGTFPNLVSLQSLHPSTATHDDDESSAMVDARQERNMTSPGTSGVPVQRKLSVTPSGMSPTPSSAIHHGDEVHTVQPTTKPLAKSAISPLPKADVGGVANMWSKAGVGLGALAALVKGKSPNTGGEASQQPSSKNSSISQGGVVDESSRQKSTPEQSQGSHGTSPRSTWSKAAFLSGKIEEPSASDILGDPYESAEGNQDDEQSREAILKKEKALQQRLKGLKGLVVASSVAVGFSKGGGLVAGGPARGNGKSPRQLVPLGGAPTRK